MESVALDLGIWFLRYFSRSRLITLVYNIFISFNTLSLHFSDTFDSLSKYTFYSLSQCRVFNLFFAYRRNTNGKVDLLFSCRRDTNMFNFEPHLSRYLCAMTGCFSLIFSSFVLIFTKGWLSYYVKDVSNRLSHHLYNAVMVELTTVFVPVQIVGLTCFCY